MFDSPKVREAIAQLKKQGRFDTEVDEEDAKELILCMDDLVLFWNRGECCILIISLRKDVDNPVQTLILTDTPVFEVEKIIAGPSNRIICLYGSKGITCVDLPRRSGKFGRFGGDNSSEVTARSYGIAEHLLVHHPKLIVQQVLFHPGSVYGNHLVVLTSDNHLRIYDTGNGKPKLFQSIRLSSADKSSFFANSSISVRGSLGETAVSFAFAPPVRENLAEVDEESCEKLWPIFVLHGNGDVFCLLSDLENSNRDEINRILGPLTMYPEATDNYGADFCSIICLHPTISCPPILVLATNAGVLYHCIALNNSQDLNDDSISQISEWSTSTAITSLDLGLYVYESVELDLGFAGLVSNDRPFDYPMFLLPDPSTPARYFCWHRSGLHCIGLPMVTHLAEMARSTENEDEMLECDQESVVEHLICTQITKHARAPSPVIGAAISHPPATLVCLLSDWTVQTLELSMVLFDSPIPLLSTLDSQKTTDVALSKEPFDQRIKMMLRKNATLPIIKGGKNADLSGQECLELLTRSTQILREEYLARFEKVRAEICKRAEYLRKMKQSQLKNLVALTQERQALREKAAELSEQYEDLKDNNEIQVKRIEKVLEKIQNRMPGLSDAEFRMLRQLKDYERKTKDLTNSIEQIRTKERFQRQQIELARKNSRPNMSSPGSKTVASPANAGIADNQMNTIKETLATQTEEISDLVKKVNSARRDLIL